MAKSQLTHKIKLITVNVLVLDCSFFFLFLSKRSSFFFFLKGQEDLIRLPSRFYVPMHPVFSGHTDNHYHSLQLGF